MCVVVVVDPADVRPSESVKAAVCRQVILVAVSQVPPAKVSIVVNRQRKSGGGGWRRIRALSVLSQTFMRESG